MSAMRKLEGLARKVMAGGYWPTFEYQWLEASVIGRAPAP